MGEPELQRRLPLRTGRGIVTLLAVLPLVLTGFVIGYGVGSGDREGTEVERVWEGGDGIVDHRPLAASFVATAVDDPAPDAPAVLPVGNSEDLGIAVAHLQFSLDESTVLPDHTAELRLPVAVPPDSEGMIVEVASVHPVDCLCSLTAATAPPYGTVWDVVEIDAATEEIVFDVTGAIDAPGRYGFAVTTPDRNAYFELEGVDGGIGPALRTVSVPVPPTGPEPPTAPAPHPSDRPTDAPPGDPGPSGDPSETPSEDPTSYPSGVPADDPSEDPISDPPADPTTDPAVDPTEAPVSGPPTGPADAPAEDPDTVPGLPVADPTLPLPATEAGQAEDRLGTCVTEDKLVPTCGALVGVAPAGHTSRPKEQALLEFEERVEHTQQIYHAYERADRRLFPTEEQIALTEDPERPRTLFINWKPQMATWGEIAAGDPEIDVFLDRLAEHMVANFDKPFFFTVHHEPENDVIQEEGSGMEAADYAAMFRYVVERLRDAGVDNLVTVMNYMGYLKWVQMPWHDQLYPGADVVDWIGLSGYGQSLHDDGHSDFGEIVDQTKGEIAWPGFYHWIATEHPDKPMMLAEWGVFYEAQYPGHQAAVFQAARYQMAHYPRLKAIVYFETPKDSNGGRDSEVHKDESTLKAFRELMQSPYFDVRLQLE
ncbi:glycosyl hydrolase [Glycomyces sp. NRRL B-16210]|uniref:glycosyl hydrolase n=1 Tax=Glycomyces sp. NRRL B-16210 TaxID=1463821 RepID=UPI000691ECD2|nr:glycosyl hydrolase [Glycomyces sp. NRRL B-16210]